MFNVYGGAGRRLGVGATAGENGGSPGRYGRADLVGQDEKDVRLGTLLSLRAARAASLCLQVSVPWLLEQPWSEEGETSMLNLDEWRDVLEELENADTPFGVRTRALQ